MSNSFKNPLTPLIPAPVNIDRPIQEMQVALSALPWLEKSFGRAFDAYVKGADDKILIYPQVWQGNGKDFLNVMPNDNLTSLCFFKVEDPIDVLEFLPNEYSQMRARVSAIFWFNYSRIDPDAAIGYPYVELLKGEAQRKLTNILFSPTSSLKILRVWEGADNVFRGYTIDKVEKQELVWPFGGFRIECELTFNEDCPDVALP